MTFQRIYLVAMAIIVTAGMFYAYRGLCSPLHNCWAG